jgi:hypothetical protein
MLFDCAVWVGRAAEEHDAFTEVLRLRDAKAITLSRLDSMHVHVPLEGSPVTQVNPPLFAAVIEQAQLDALRAPGEQREVGSPSVPRGSLRERPSRPDVTHRPTAPWRNSPPSDRRRTVPSIVSL